MRQFHIVVSKEETFMNFVGKCKCVDQTVLAGGTFTGDHRTYFGSGTACHQSILHQVFTDRFDIFERYALNFDGQSGSHGNFAISVQFCSFCDRTGFFCGDLTVSCNDTAVKTVACCLVPQESPCFYTGNVCR